MCVHVCVYMYIVCVLTVSFLFVLEISEGIVLVLGLNYIPPERIVVHSPKDLGSTYLESV